MTIHKKNKETLRREFIDEVTEWESNYNSKFSLRAIASIVIYFAFMIGLIIYSR